MDRTMGASCGPIELGESEDSTDLRILDPHMQGDPRAVWSVWASKKWMFNLRLSGRRDD